MTEEKRLTRKRQLHVPVLPDEEAAIKKMAASTGLSVAANLRNIGLGYQVRSILDNKRVEELARINGDLGRLGGLLKLWLTNDPRTAQYGSRLIHALLSKIKYAQSDARDHADRGHAKGQTMNFGRKRSVWELDGPEGPGAQAGAALCQNRFRTGAEKVRRGWWA
jgi:hypothetical protein